MQLDRLNRLQEGISTLADVAFVPISADLHYLLGIPRDVPNFGRVMHPGAWLEGLWLAPGKTPVLTVPRMSVEFGGLHDAEGVELRVLGDWDDPVALVRDILHTFTLSARPRIALSDSVTAETVTALQTLYPEAAFVSSMPLLREMRVIKNEAEIETMRQAGAITEAAFADVLKQLKIGMTELDIISEIDYQLRRHGALGPSFATSLYNSGPDHPLLFGERLQTWPRILMPPVSVLFDFGAIFEGYCYDFGRTVSFGAPSEEQQQVHALVMASQAAGMAAMQAGNATAEAVDHAARQIIEDAGYGEMFRHRLGHGIGLDVHEPPFLTKGDSTVLQAGMLFTVEPSITQFSAFSARVEDVVVVRPGGGEALTHGFQDLIVIE